MIINVRILIETVVHAVPYLELALMEANYHSYCKTKKRATRGIHAMIKLIRGNR